MLTHFVDAPVQNLHPTVLRGARRMAKTDFYILQGMYDGKLYGEKKVLTPSLQGRLNARLRTEGETVRWTQFDQLTEKERANVAESPYESVHA